MSWNIIIELINKLNFNLFFKKTTFYTLIFFLVQFIIYISSNKTLGQEYQTFETYQSQIIGGINFNSNAGLIGGGMIRYNRHIKKNQYHYLGFEITNVKHPKEVLSVNSNGNIFTAYKTNVFLPMRFQYGREFLLFEPAEEEGVQINLILAGGISFGIKKPYMIEYDYNGISKILPFDPDNSNPIIGKASFFEGFDQSKIVPGINLKAALSIELAQFRDNVSGIEIGCLLEAYSSKIEMMRVTQRSTVQPQSFSTFSSVYINIFFGFRN
ncbi:MAG: hypothetical protein EAZ07_07815 [Cytophagales bacterium]|nr:MAG: hypothetical protein EAZ07_07815 [Cytophagales bacterium]